MASRNLFVASKGASRKFSLTSSQPSKSKGTPYDMPTTPSSFAPSSTSNSNWTMLIILTSCMITMTFLQWLQYLRPASAINEIMNSAYLPLSSSQSASVPLSSSLSNAYYNVNVSRVHMHSSIRRFKRLIFYNRPPKTGSTSVRIAMKRALDAVNMVSAKCFNRIEWNEMSMRTIIKRRNIDFYGCHTRLTDERYNELLYIRGHNVTLMTSTREPSRLILSSYLQENFRNVNVSEVEQHIDVPKEKERYLKFVNSYPIDALYAYHGGIIPLTQCPVTREHIDEMKRIVQRYEIVVNLEKPKESQAMIKLITGLEPNLEINENVRVKEVTPLLRHLLRVNTSHRTCGNELVHNTLIQQFNLIKDRLMHNDCYDESAQSHSKCDDSVLNSQ